MPAAKPPEFRRRAIALTPAGTSRSRGSWRIWGSPSPACAAGSSRTTWDTGRRSDGLTGDERKELAELRRRNRMPEMEMEVLERASAYFARENVLPSGLPGGSRTRRRLGARRDGLPGPARLSLGL